MTKIKPHVPALVVHNLVHRLVLLVSIAMITVALDLASADEISKSDLEFFEKKIRPALSQHCYQCHSAKSKELGGKLLLDQRAGVLAGGESGSVIKPGKPDESLLIQALKYEGTEMPPEKPLPKQVINDFVEWIKRGAPDPRVPTKPKKAVVQNRIKLEHEKHWSFFPRTNPAAPKVKDKSWPLDPIDFFVLSKLEAASLQPTGDASSRVLIRRLYYDLIGLPPTYLEVEEFVQDCKANRQNAIKSIVDRLLAKPQFGERWGRHWLDVARYGESNGDDGLGRNASFPQAWRYRDYVIDSFNKDVSYDQFIVEQIAGDLLPAEDASQRNRQLVATGFLAIGSKPAAAMNKNFAMDVVDDQINAVSLAVTGLSVACARCHDHKHDPIPTRDYYALAGIFSSTETLYGRAADEKLTAPPTPLHSLFNKWNESTTKPKLIKQTPKFKPGYKVALQETKPLVLAELINAPENLKVEGKATFSDKTFGKFENSKLIGTVPKSNSSYSVSFWFKNDLKNSQRPITAYLFSRGKIGDQNIGDHLGIGGIHDKSRTGKLFVFNGSNTKKTIGGETVIQPGTWNHVVMVRKEGQISLYLNGVTEPEFQGKLPVTFGQNKDFLAATRADHFAPLTGNMAYFTLFDRAITPKEIQTLHASSGLPKGVRAPRPIGFAMGVRDKGKPADTKVHINGETGKFGPAVTRGFLSAYEANGWKPEKKTEIPKNQSGRLQLARFLTRPDHPQTARVAVNRIWLQLFGQGIVSTPDDFGVFGSRPSHPELLDHLAERFVNQKWSFKKLIRSIVLSRTYQLDSRGSTELANKDPDNRLYGRHLVRRLDAESLRDSLLNAAGRLELTPKAGSDIQEVVKLINWPIGESSNLHKKSNHRSVYLCMLRHAPPPELAAFDLPDPTRVTGIRTSSTLPSQSLFMLNSPLVVEQSGALAKELLSKAGWTDDIRIKELYLRALQRLPSEEEIKRAITFVRNGRQDSVESGHKDWANLCQAVMASNEFRFID